MSAYPALTAERLMPLVTVKRAMLIDPGYLSTAPWPAAIKRTVRELLEPVEAHAEPVSNAKLDDPSTWTDVASKTRQLYARLEAMTHDLDRGDTTEAIQIVKAQAGLLERLIACGDKAVGLKANADFKAAVLAALHEASPDLRTAVMAGLETRT